jgi:hypothetical protein
MVGRTESCISSYTPHSIEFIKLTYKEFTMRLYFDTTQANYLKRLPTIKQNDLLYVICACPIIFEDNEPGDLTEILYLLTVPAWAIVKEMSFKFVENTIQSTPTKASEALESGSGRKRSRMSSPSPAKGKLKAASMPLIADDNEIEEEKDKNSQTDTINVASQPQTPTLSTLNHHQNTTKVYSCHISG